MTGITRTLTFPDDRTMGALHVSHGKGRIRFHGRFTVEGELLPDATNPEWQILKDAQGTVGIPSDNLALLEVFANEARDLSPLASLKPDDLDGLWLGNTLVHDEQLQYVAHLTGLQWIDVQNNMKITDAGIAFLKDLKSLTSFGAHWTRISATSLQYLAAMSRLKYVDIWGCEIPDEAVDEFRTRLPNCKVRTR